MDTITGINAFKDNYIWMITDTARQYAVVIDPGDATAVQSALTKNKLQLTAILITHHHPDHIGGITALLRQYDVPVYGPKNERIPGRTQALAEGDIVSLPGLPWQLDVIDVPGHTGGHIAYHGVIDDRSVLFCGDTLFSGGCGRLFDGTPRGHWFTMRFSSESS